MGVDIERLQDAYRGFARGNYTMLDNLSLGYAGTKEEMQRLLDDAGKLANTKFDISSYADVVQAIHVMQENMGIAGTTAKEASTTIQGSLSSMKSAWQNLVTGIADPTQDLTQLISNFVGSVSIVAGNIMPVIQQALTGIGQLVQQLAPIISEQLPSLIESVVPSLLQAGGTLLQGLITGITQALPALVDPAIQVITQLGNFFIENMPLLIEAAIQIVTSLADGITQALPELIPAVVDAIITIVDTLIDNVDQLVDAAIEIIMALADGLIEALPKLIEKAPEIVVKLVEAIARNAPKLLEAAAELIGKLAFGIIESLPEIGKAAGEIISTIVKGISDLIGKIKDVGKNIVKGLWDGITGMGDWIKQKVNGFFDGVVGGVKGFLGIHSPSTVFAGIGENMALGLGKGWDKSFDKVAGDIQNGLDFSGDLAYNTYSNGSAFGGSATGYGQGTQVVQNIYSQAKTAADLMEEARWNFDMAVAF